MKKLLLLLLLISNLCFSLICYSQALKSGKQITDLSYLKSKPEFEYYNWNNKTNSGSGVMKNGYVVQSKSWSTSESYGIILVNLTTSAKLDMIFSEKKPKEYIAYLNEEIKRIALIQLKDKSALKEIELAILHNKGKINNEDGTYYILTDNKVYNEISVIVKHIGSYSHIITITCQVFN